MIESVVIICENSPIGKNSAIESIRLGAGFMGLGEEIECKLIFMGDAVYTLSKNADPKAVGTDSFEEPLEMADLSDLEINILDSALSDAGLTRDDLTDYENLRVISENDLIEILENATTAFRF